MISPCEECVAKREGPIQSEQCRTCEARVEYERLGREREYEEYIRQGLTTNNPYLKSSMEYETVISPNLKLSSGLASDIETLMAACSKVLARLK